MRGANPLFLAAALRNRSQRAPMDFGPVASLASEQAFLDERGRQAQSMDRQFNTPVFGGEIAPIVGLLRGLSKVAQRRQGDAKLEDLRADWEADVRAQQEAEAEQARQEAEAKRIQELQDRAWEHGQKLDAERRGNEEWERRFNLEQQAKASDPEVGGPDVKGEGDLRKELSGLSKDFNKQHSAFGRILASYEEPSAAGDLALIFNYMKVLDPGSTVREGEFATAQNSGGIDSTIYNQYNRILSGERLSTKQRDDFVGRAFKLYDKAREEQTERRSNYETLAGEYGFDPSRVVPSRQFHEFSPQQSFGVSATDANEVGAEAIPPEVDPGDWQYMTPEQKKLFAGES